jgi:V/A-type H+/Na+-transporting ATPase subunit C
MSRSDYLYAAGVVRFWENKLLNPTDIKRMVDAPDLASAFKVFHDTDYFDNVLDTPPEEFVRALDADLEQARARVIEMTPDKKIAEFAFKRHDFHNLKLMLKEKYLERDLSENVSPLGNVEPVKVKALVGGEKNIDMADYLKDGYEYVVANLGSEVLPRDIDRLCDKAFFAEHAKSAEGFNNEWISNLVSWQIDIANLKIFIRAKKLEYDKVRLAEELVPGGEIKEDFFVNILGSSEEEAMSNIRMHLPNSTRELLDNYLKSSSLSELERDLENIELDYIRKAKFIDFGPEVVIAYYMAKKNAIRNVRLIMTGKLNNIPAREIENMVREIY